MADLDERQRVVLELNADGRKNVEIGAIVGCSKGEASRRLTAARKTAIERLTGHCEATVCQKYDRLQPVISRIGFSLS